MPAWTCLCVVTFWEGLGGGRCAGWVSRQGGRWRGKRRGRRERGRGTYEGNEMPRFHGRWSVGACGPPAKASDLMEERKEGRKKENEALPHDATMHCTHCSGTLLASFFVLSHPLPSFSTCTIVTHSSGWHGRKPRAWTPHSFLSPHPHDGFLVVFRWSCLRWCRDPVQLKWCPPLPCPSLPRASWFGVCAKPPLQARREHSLGPLAASR